MSFGGEANLVEHRKGKRHRDNMLTKELEQRPNGGARPPTLRFTAFGLCIIDILNQVKYEVSNLDVIPPSVFRRFLAL